MKNKAPPVHVIQLLATVEHWRMLKALFFFSEMEKKKTGKQNKNVIAEIYYQVYLSTNNRNEDLKKKKLVFIEFSKFLIFESIQFQCNGIEWKWFLVLDSNHLFKANKRIARITPKWMAHS